eukprot:15186412-Alexandrium_andersonii.AAC.1
MIELVCLNRFPWRWVAANAPRLTIRSRSWDVKGLGIPLPGLALMLRSVGRGCVSGVGFPTKGLSMGGRG